MIKALEVSSNYEVVRPPKGANWLPEVYVVQRQCLRATTGRPSNPRIPISSGPSEALSLRDFEPPHLNPEPDFFEIDLEFAEESLALLEF